MIFQKVAIEKYFDACILLLGCAIYTGPDTKMSQNSKYQVAKFSRVER